MEPAREPAGVHDGVTGRIASLDVIRGVAVMGIFSVNVIGFSMPFQAYLNPAAYGGTTGASLAVWAANFVLIDGKMRGLFTLLFGASMLLVAQRAQACGRSAALTHYSRMAWLLAFGCLHYYLVWTGDILTLYAIVGMIAYLFHPLPARVLMALGLGFLCLDMLMGANFWVEFVRLEQLGTAPGATARAAAAYRGSVGFISPLSPGELHDSISLYRSGFATLLHDRVTEGLTGPLDQIQFGWAEALGAMFVGMAGLKSGFLGGTWRKRTYVLGAAAGIGTGMVGYVLLAWRSWASGFDPIVVFADFFVLMAPFRVAMMLGYAALIILLAAKGGPVAGRVAAVGRSAFTNYLGTSLIAAGLFFGWGLGLFGRLDRFQSWLVVPLVWGIMLAWSTPWLRRWRYGPFEWAWRSLSRWHLQPMRRVNPAIAGPAS
jgi:uncharacterized protein